MIVCVWEKMRERVFVCRVVEKEGGKMSCTWLNIDCIAFNRKQNRWVLDGMLVRQRWRRKEYHIYRVSLAHTHILSFPFTFWAFDLKSVMFFLCQPHITKDFTHSTHHYMALHFSYASNGTEHNIFLLKIICFTFNFFYALAMPPFHHSHFQTKTVCSLAAFLLLLFILTHSLTLTSRFHVLCFFVVYLHFDSVDSIAYVSTFRYVNFEIVQHFIHLNARV